MLYHKVPINLILMLVNWWCDGVMVFGERAERQKASGYKGPEVWLKRRRESPPI